MSLADILAGSIALALLVYVLLGGADFGGGVWDLLARGRGAAGERRLIAEAIGPIWEANHVWLIAAIVVLFTGFPAAFAALGTVLHIPLTLVLLGIVLRGSAFMFHLYAPRGGASADRWGRVFAAASIATPVFLGVTLGAIVSGRIRVTGAAPTRSAYVDAWLHPFGFAVGLLTLSLFALLAAAYLAVEANDPALRDVFRRKARWTWLVTVLLAAATYALAMREAPEFARRLVSSPWSAPVLIAAAGAAAAGVWSLGTGRVLIARACAVLQATTIVVGWAAAQYPYLIAPDVTIASAAAPHRTLVLLAIALAGGAILLAPSFAYLFVMFKGRRVFAVVDAPERHAAPVMPPQRD